MSLRLLLGLKASMKKERSPYISATEFDNFINNDLVCDWLSLVLPKKVDTHPLQSLFNKGIHHEAVVIDRHVPIVGVSKTLHFCHLAQKPAR